MSAKITEVDIAKVLKLVPEHSTAESLRKTDELDHLTTAQIHQALDTLVARGKVRAGELFGRDERT